MSERVISQISGALPLMKVAVPATEISLATETPQYVQLRTWKTCRPLDNDKVESIVK